jgi:hypothetical protein
VVQSYFDAVVPADAEVDTTVILNPDDDEGVGIDGNDAAHWITIHVGEVLMNSQKLPNTVAFLCHLCSP